MMNKNIPNKILNGEKIAILSCCAPCSVEIIERLSRLKINATVIFYNPNIFPIEEYLLRKEENKKVCERFNIPFIDFDYEPNIWLEKTKGLEKEPEKGKRCDVCFLLRLNKTAKYAKENGFKYFSSTLGVSRWKDINQVNRCGLESASNFNDLTYIDLELRKNGAQDRRLKLIKEVKTYEQSYCGCPFSHGFKKD